MRRTHSLLLVPLVALAACGGEGESSGTAAPAPSSTAPTTAPATTTVPATTTTPSTLPPLAGGSSDGTTTETSVTTAPPATTTPPTTSAPTTVPAPTTTAAEEDGDCLIGEWIVADADVNRFYDTLETTVDTDMSIATSGSIGLNFTETTYEYLPNFTLELDVAGQSATGATTGSVSGEYDTAGGLITTSLNVPALDIEVTVSGNTFDGSDMGNGILTSVPINDAAYRCDGGIPTIDFETGPGNPVVPITLQPAG